MELFKLLGTIAIDAADALKAFKKTQEEGEKTESKLSKVFSGIGKGAAVCGKAIMAGLAVGATAMAGLTMKALSASGELEQNLGGAEAVFGDLGDSIDKMSTKVITGYDKATGKAIYETRSLEKESKEAYKNMGLSQSDYLATANKMGALFKGAGFETQEALDLSSQAMQRAADVASIMGIDTEAAMEAVAGAAKGNFTMMDNLGVAMNDTAIAAYAQSKGINKATSEMTQQEKIGLAMEMFLEKTSYAAGNYAKENETLAGSLSTAKAAFTNFLAGSGDVDSLVSSFSNLANVVVKNLTEIAPRLTSGISDLVQQVVPLIPPLLNTLLPVLVEGATSLINGLVAALPGIISAILDVLPLLIDGVMQIVDALVGALPGIMQALVDALPTLIPALIDGIISMTLMLVEMLPQIIQPLIDSLPTIIISIVEALVNNLPALIQGVIQLIMGIVTALPQIIQALVDAIPTIVSLLVEAILNNLPAIIMGLIQVVMGIVKAIPQIFQALYIELPTALWKGIFDGLGKAFSGLGNWFGKTFSKAKEWAVKAWSDAKEKFNNVKEKAVSGFNDLKTKVGDKFNEAKEAAAKKWSDAKSKFESIKGKVVSAFDNIKDKLAPKFEEAKQKAQNAWANTKAYWNKLKEGDIVGVFSDLGGKLKSKFSSALNIAKQGFNKIKTIGKDLVSGLWNGINDKFEWLTGKIKGFTKGVTSKLKGFFGIKSPSRVMRDEVGKMLAEGVAVGIDANSEKAESAAEKMAKNVLDAAQKRLDNYKTYNEMTLADEVGFWDSVRMQVKEGTDARVTADQKYAEAKKSLNDEILSAEETLQDKLDEIAQRVTDRQKEIVDSMSLFGEAEFDEYLGKSQLIKNAEQQVNVMGQYETIIDSLREKIGDTALFKELESMGINALPNLMAVDIMSESELAKYVSLYDEKIAKAGTIAAKELQEETIADTEAAYQEFEKSCASLGVEIVDSTGAMATGVKNAFSGIAETVQEAGNTIAEVCSEKIKKPLDDVAISLGSPAIFSYDAASGEFGGYANGSGTQAGKNHDSIVISYLQKLVEILSTAFPQLAEAFNVQLRLDTGVLVGELAEPMNEALGRISSRKDRGL